MDSNAAIKQCLEEMDVDGIRSLWHLVAPDAPQPETDFEAMVTLHMARTQMKIMTKRQRYYSHRWLLDHDQMSLLPDEERPSAERMYPQIKRSVGISLGSQSSMMEPALPVIRGEMEKAVLEVYADGRKDDIPFLKERMRLAREGAVKKLFGKIDG